MPRIGKRKREALDRAHEDSLARPRLADKVAILKWSPPSWFLGHGDELRESWLAMADVLKTGIGEAIVIAAENVGEYLFAVTPQEEWDFIKDFPCCAPPFPCVFVEFRRPSRINSEGRILSTQRNMPPSWGWFIEASTFEDVAGRLAEPEAHQRQVQSLSAQLISLAPFVDRSRIDAALASADIQAAIQQLGNTERTFVALVQALKHSENLEARLATFRQIHPGVAWFLKASLVMESFESSGPPVIIGPVVEYTFSIGANGHVLYKPAMMFAGGHIPEFLNHSQEYTDFTSLLLFPAMLAISFMNCKNVTLEAIEPNAELNRIRQRRGDRPFLRYHTIDIEPMKRVLRTEGQVDAVGLKRALHIVRGHFSTYTPERPLFGKVAGTFWVPSHVRGSAREGVVISDYAVHPPVRVEEAHTP
jgi:hypothetical protein